MTLDEHTQATVKKTQEMLKFVIDNEDGNLETWARQTIRLVCADGHLPPATYWLGGGETYEAVANKAAELLRSEKWRTRRALHIAIMSGKGGDFHRYVFAIACLLSFVDAFDHLYPAKRKALTPLVAPPPTTPLQPIPDPIPHEPEEVV